jgi:site-specific recombinase XerD
MDEFNALYHFINLAQKNRKYPANTAQGKRAALKLFQTVLHADELESLDLIKERMKDIYLSLISKHRENFSIQSLNTYKGRFLKVIEDYKKYGSDPEALAHWEAKIRKYKPKDMLQDTQKDILISNSSLPIHRHVYKIKITLEDGQECSIELPARLTKEDVSIITKIIGSLV